MGYVYRKVTGEIICKYDSEVVLPFYYNDIRFDDAEYYNLDISEDIKNPRILDGVVVDILVPLEEVVKVVPQEITKLQAMRAMKQVDLWSSFQLIISSNMEAKDEWELALNLDRSNPFVVALAPMLSLTEEQLDDLFILAGGL